MNWFTELNVLFIWIEYDYKWDIPSQGLDIQASSLQSRPQHAKISLQKTSDVITGLALVSVYVRVHVCSFMKGLHMLYFHVYTEETFSQWEKQRWRSKHK